MRGAYVRFKHIYPRKRSIGELVRLTYFWFLGCVWHENYHSMWKLNRKLQLFFRIFSLVPDAKSFRSGLQRSWWLNIFCAGAFTDIEACMQLPPLILLISTWIRCSSANSTRHLRSPESARLVILATTLLHICTPAYISAGAGFCLRFCLATSACALCSYRYAWVTKELYIGDRVLNGLETPFCVCMCRFFRYHQGLVMSSSRKFSYYAGVWMCLPHLVFLYSLHHLIFPRAHIFIQSLRDDARS